MKNLINLKNQQRFYLKRVTRSNNSRIIIIFIHNQRFKLKTYLICLNYNNNYSKYLIVIILLLVLQLQEIHNNSKGRNQLLDLILEILKMYAHLHLLQLLLSMCLREIKHLKDHLLNLIQPVEISVIIQERLQNDEIINIEIIGIFFLINSNVMLQSVFLAFLSYHITINKQHEYFVFAI